MAYGNWGAFVYKDGQRQQKREDNTPYKEDELEQGYWQAFYAAKNKEIHPHHASLGDGKIRLCGYKSYPSLYWDGELIDIDQFRIGERKNKWWDDREIKGEIHGYKFSAIIHEYPESVSLELIEPNGIKWTSECGFEMGAGWQDCY